MKNIAIILGAGKSLRCGFDKILHEHQGASALEKCLKTFSECESIDDIWVVHSDDQSISIEAEKLKGFIPGGEERFFSVKNALEHCKTVYPENVRVIVHNAANPHLSVHDLKAGIKKAEITKNVIFGGFTPNSIKKVENGKVTQYLKRSEIFETQTPQISDLATFTKALHKVEDKDPIPKDEAELLDLIGETVYVYECDPRNTKITHASDFATGVKIGIGEDAHKFASDFDPKKPFRLGGIEVSGGLLSSDGNSDGDIILHALCNALLSAFGDKTFDPIADPVCRAGDTHSESYLKATLEHLGMVHILQVLISLEGAQPKIAPHHDAIQTHLAKLLEIKTSQIGLTYTTGESLSEVGKGLGMRGFVIVIVE